MEKVWKVRSPCRAAESLCTSSAQGLRPAHPSTTGQSHCVWLTTVKSCCPLRRKEETAELGDTDGDTCWVSGYAFAKGLSFFIYLHFCYLTLINTLNNECKSSHLEGCWLWGCLESFTFNNPGPCERVSPKNWGRSIFIGFRKKLFFFHNDD